MNSASVFKVLPDVRSRHGAAEEGAREGEQQQEEAHDPKSEIPFPLAMWVRCFLLVQRRLSSSSSSPPIQKWDSYCFASYVVGLFKPFLFVYMIFAATKLNCLSL